MGVYRRRIRLRSRQGRVTAELEDDFHHFRVTLDHDGQRVTAVSGEGIRYPWHTCPLAAAELLPLVGTPLSPRSTAVGVHVAARQNCTHMFDLAGLAVAQAATGRGDRQYDAEVPDRAEGATRPKLWRDGGLVLAWTVEGSRITGPPPFAGRRLRGGGFLAWAEAELDPETAEAAIVLRRACEIALGRGGDLDDLETAASLAPLVSGACYSFQPERIAGARRMKGTARDFTTRPELLLEGDGRG